MIHRLPFRLSTIALALATSLGAGVATSHPALAAAQTCTTSGSAGTTVPSNPVLNIHYSGSSVCDPSAPIAGNQVYAYLTFNGNQISGGSNPSCACASVTSNGQYDNPTLGSTYVLNVNSVVTLQSGYQWTSAGNGCTASGAVMNCHISYSFTFPIPSSVGLV